MRRGGPQVSVDVDETPAIGLNACRTEVQAGGIRHPAHRHDRKRGLGAVPYALFREDHPHAARCLLERLDHAEALAHDYSRLTKGSRDHSRYVLVLGGKNARASLEELDP